jgi:hypothetical protein
LLVIAWLVPAVIITAHGAWTDVTKVFQPGPGDPVRIQRSSGKCVTLYGAEGSRPGNRRIGTQVRRRCERQSWIGKVVN